MFVQTGNFFFLVFSSLLPLPPQHVFPSLLSFIKSVPIPPQFISRHLRKKVPESRPDPSCDPLLRGHPSAAGPRWIEGGEKGADKELGRGGTEADGGEFCGLGLEVRAGGERGGVCTRGNEVIRREAGEKWPCRSARTASPPYSADQGVRAAFTFSR